MTEQTYFQQWYKNNKEKHNAARKKRYAEDKEYREQAIGVVHRYREVGPHKPIKRLVDGKQVNVYPIQHAAHITDRQVVTVQSWIDKGFVPHAVVKDENRSYFTAKQIQWMKVLAKELSAPKSNKKYASRDELVADIHKHWSD